MSRRNGAISSRSSSQTRRRRRAAADRIAKGACFAEIAKERGLTDKDIDLGTLPKAGVIDRAVADAAFALKEGEVSAPVQGRFGTTLVQVLKIEPEQVRPSRRSRPSSSRSWRPRAPRPRSLTLYDKIEDARAEGKTLAEAAAKLKLAARTIEAIDRSGRDPSGAPVTGLPEAQRLAGDRVLHRHRRRPRSAADRGRLHLVRDRRHHALARAAARRGQGPGRGALAGAGDCRAPERQGDRDAGQAQGRHEPGGGRRSRPVEGREPDRDQARRAAGAAFGAAVEAIFRTAKDAAGRAERRSRPSR